MSEIVQAVSHAVHPNCQVKKCLKQGCGVSMEGAPESRVLVDLDCDDLDIAWGDSDKRCDYLFVGEEKVTAYVAPIELKGGGFKTSEVIGQLQGGANAADKWLPPGDAFQFVPILVHGKGIHPEDLRKLRRAKIKLRKHEPAPVLIRCKSKGTGMLASAFRHKAQ